MNTEKKIVILGAGIAGISAGYHLKSKGISSVIFEQRAYSGGLCNSFSIQGFTFDTFVHFSFTKDDTVRKLFNSSAESFSHPPESQNFWKGNWLRHPVQNNLWAPLNTSKKGKFPHG